MSETTALIGLAALWLAYAAIHSLLAANAVKAAIIRRWPGAAGAYRLAYNALAGLLLLPPLALLFGRAWTPLWTWPGLWAWVSHGLGLLAVLGFWLSSRHYDMADFLGFKASTVKTGFCLSPWHCHVRHPWYALGLLLIWSRPMDSGFLLTACVLTLYFVIGSRLEEQKLIAQYGEVYRAYCQRVPGLVPLPWRRLRADEAAALIALAQRPEC